jgi:fructose-1,6-bisphosphatase/inositol monophosphatase family enzyme/ADP-ribosylglycohydrolase
MIRADFHRPGGPRGHGDHADVDLEAEQLIRARLTAAFPDWGYRGEETGSSPMEPPPRYVWLVDPNDGTRSFLQGYRGSSVSIALLRDRQPVLGVVYAPSAPDDDGDFIAWAEGCGPVTRNGAPVVREPWATDLAEADVLLSQDADYAPRTNLACVSPARFRAVNSIAYRLALAAVGDAAAAGSAKGAGDWDYAGGHALVRAMGGDLLLGPAGVIATYSPRGESRGRTCFGGDPATAGPLAGLPWRNVNRWEPPDPTIPPSLRAALPEASAAIADAALLRRAHGCLLGHLAGDALGALAYGENVTTLRQRFPDGLRNMTGGGAWNTMAGQPTDASEMALALGRSLYATGSYDPENAARAYAYWYHSNPFHFDQSVSQALGSIPATHLLPWGGRTGGAAEMALAAASGPSQSPVSLMRQTPFGIWGHRLDPDTLADGARADSRLTHPHPVCRESCAAFVIAIAYAVGTGATAAETYRHTLDWAARNCSETAVVDTLQAAAREPSRGNGGEVTGVLSVLQSAFHQLLHAPSFEAGVVATVMQGGPATIRGAITGALLGAVYGREAIPRPWRRCILSCHPIQGIPGVTQPRPAPFWPVDALDLAEGLLLTAPH